VVGGHDPEVVVVPLLLIPLVTRRHGEKLFDRDRAVARIQRVGWTQVVADRRLCPLDLGGLQRLTDEERDDTLGDRAYVEPRLRARASEVSFDHQLAVPHDQEAAEAGNGGRVLGCSAKRERIEPHFSRRGGGPGLGQVDGARRPARGRGRVAAARRNDEPEREELS